MKLDLKVLVRHHVGFKNKWAGYATVFAGLAFFLLTFHYFGVTNLLNCGFGEVLFSMILPMAVLVAFVVLLRGICFHVTPVYGILGALYCVSMIAYTFSYESALHAIFAMIWYLLAAGICLATTFGYISNRAYMAIAFILPAVYRLIFVDLGTHILKLDILGFIPEAAMLSGLMVFGLFALCLQAAPVKKTARRRPKAE